jgi:hypothetical protein
LKQDKQITLADFIQQSSKVIAKAIRQDKEIKNYPHRK